MPVLHRQIRRLRLAATRDEHVRHGRILCEDALRTATIDDHGRLIIVRRLALGAVPATAPASTWSRRIETGLARLPGQLVRADSPLAGRAAAVFFTHAEEPWQLLAVRAALGQAMTEWFWPVALPDWVQQTSPRENLRLAFRTLAARPTGLLPTLQLAHRLATVRALPVLLQALEPGDLQDLSVTLAALASADVAVAAEAPGHDISAPSRTEMHISAGEPIVGTWPPGDLRVLWFASYLASIPAAAGTLPGPSILQSPDRKRVAPILTRLRRPSLRLEPVKPPASRPPDPVASRAAPPLDPATAPGVDRPGTRTADTLPDDTDLFPDRLPTMAGGLFFMIHLLERSQLVQRLEQLPESQRPRFVARIVQLALRHARIPRPDPIWRFLPEDLPDASCERRNSAPTFLLQAHRHGRALCGMGLREIIARPALLAMNSTHVDLFFRNREADLRLRRAGLDIDPGWVRWLGRAVAFHYNRED